MTEPTSKDRAKPPDPRLHELLIDCEEDRRLRALMVGMLREAERSGPSQDPPRAAHQASEARVSSLRRHAWIC